jgi:hypothetical protein
MSLVLKLLFLRGLDTSPRLIPPVNSKPAHPILDPFFSLLRKLNVNGE